MKKRRRLLIVAAAALAILVIAGIVGVEYIVPPRRVEPAAAPVSPVATPHITATLFFATPNGQKLLPVRREVPLADSLGVQVLTAQLAPAPAPYVSVIPKGTKLRQFFVTEGGDAFVDLTPEVTTAHPGGSTAELLTVYAIVNAITSNLPAVQRVQILVDGKEVDTIAGHVDMRRPIGRDASLISQP
jgi:spore germination protein GerM